MNMPDSETGLPWSDLLMCWVAEMRVDFAKHEATLVLHKDGCTDMEGAIILCTAVDKDCWMIKTLAGARPDTVYHRDPLGVWVAEGSDGV